MEFISLVGAQTLAVLNPLLALIQQGAPPQRVTLLATPFTMRRAENLKAFLTPDKLDAEAVAIIPISDSLTIDPNGLPPAQTVIADLLLNDMCFNLAGGMNFQMAACVQVLQSRRCVFIYPEAAGIHAFTVAGGRLLNNAFWPLPNPVDVLSLQETPFTLAQKPLNPYLADLLKTAGFKLPPDAQTHVTIGNVTFDLVWNSGNELKFIKVITLEKAKTAGDYLKEVRDVITLARNREKFGELYHRNTVVFTDSKDIAERISVEGAGKLNAIYYPRGGSALGSGLLANRLKALLKPPSRSTTLPKETIVQTGNAIDGDAMLYLSLGANVMSSYTALWSHAPAHVCFVYTPQVAEIERFRNVLLAQKKHLPVKTLIFYPVGIEGVEILNLPRPSSAATAVNITPGAKGHAAFLTIWAEQHGAPVFSMNNTTSRYEQIPEGASGALTAPPPASFFKLSGLDVKQYGADKGSILSDRVRHEALLYLFSRMDEMGVSFMDFPAQAISAGDTGSVLVEKQLLKIWREGQENVYISLKGNEWFETLIGFVMTRCGAQDVQVRLRTAWSEETEKDIQARKQDAKKQISPYMTDVDVAARIQANYYVISCKATKKDAPAKLTAEADAFAAIFGRFAVPLLCFLKYDGEPVNTTNNVYIFGYKTFCDMQQMQGLLKKALVERRKTGSQERNAANGQYL